MAKTHSTDPDLRISEYQQAIATFARLHEELTELRDNVTVPEASARIERMLRLNEETLNTIKASLALAIASQRRLEAHPETVAAYGVTHFPGVA